LNLQNSTCQTKYKLQHHDDDASSVPTTQDGK